MDTLAGKHITALSSPRDRQKTGFGKLLSAILSMSGESCVTVSDIDFSVLNSANAGDIIVTNDSLLDGDDIITNVTKIAELIRRRVSHNIGIVISKNSKKEEGNADIEVLPDGILIVHEGSKMAEALRNAVGLEQ